MSQERQGPSHREQVVRVGQWVLLGTVVGLAAGSASALFLWLLDQATALREQRPTLVFGLPLAGLALGWLYERYGNPVKGGNNLVIDTLHDGGPEIPLRMAPMVLGGTVLTHLFGGSAGREGTAVQMGASLADHLSHRLRLSPDLRRDLLAAGVAGGFGAVFGTPIAGAIFGLEFVVCGRIAYTALLPALTAAVVGDLTTRAFGIVHTVFPVPAALALDTLLLGKWLLFAVAIAAVSSTFIELTHRLRRWLERRVPRAPVRLLLGGLAVVGLWQVFGTSAYLGLGVPTIVSAFSDPSLPSYAFAAKLLFTAVTLAAGFVGGEVTPLFFIGATLGNALGRLLDLPLDVAAGVGLAAMFATASKTPIALSIMAVELLGAALFPHVAIVAVVANLLGGRRSIYPSQRWLDPQPRP